MKFEEKKMVCSSYARFQCAIYINDSFSAFVTRNDTLKLNQIEEKEKRMNPNKKNNARQVKEKQRAETISKIPFLFVLHLLHTISFHLRHKKVLEIFSPFFLVVVPNFMFTLNEIECIVWPVDRGGWVSETPRTRPLGHGY